MLHVVAAATFVGATQKAIESPRRESVVTLGAAIFGLGAVAALVVGHAPLILLLLPVTVTSTSVYCTQHASRIAGMAGPRELHRFGGAVYRLTQVTAAFVSVLFTLAILKASDVLPDMGAWILAVLLFIAASSTAILMLVWTVYHMILMSRIKRWLALALIGLMFFDSAGEDEPPAETQ